MLYVIIFYIIYSINASSLAKIFEKSYTVLYRVTNEILLSAPLKTSSANLSVTTRKSQPLVTDSPRQIKITLRQFLTGLPRFLLTLRARYSVILLFCKADFPDYWGLYCGEHLKAV